MKKIITLSIAAVLTFLLVTIGSFGDINTNKKNKTEIISIELSSTAEITLDKDNRVYIGYAVIKYSGDKPDESCFVAVSTDENVAAAKITDVSVGLLKYEIEAVGSGTTTVYIEALGESVRSAEAVARIDLEGSTYATDEIFGSASSSADVEGSPATDKSHEIEESLSVTVTDEPAPDVIEAHEYWVLNTNSKKIHTPNCSSAAQISAKNYSTTYDLNEAIEAGYVWCKRCGK